jgi:FkbM family methyltransferase
LAARLFLRAWSGAAIAPGYLYQAVEKWGPYLADGPLDCRLFTGAVVNCDLRDHIQRHIYFFGAYEPIESWLFQRLVSPGDTVVDAGANIGQYTLIAAQAVGPSGTVHAFEPVPANYHRAVAHVSANGFQDRARINQSALWHSRGMIELRRSANDADNRGAYTSGVCDVAVDTFVSETVLLDEYATRHGIERLDVMKVDAEGAELFILEGARAVLEAYRPTILMEINREACRQQGYEPEAIDRLLRPLGYLFRSIRSTGQLSRSLPDFRELSRLNVLAHARPLPASVTSGWTQKAILRSHYRST